MATKGGKPFNHAVLWWMRDQRARKPHGKGIDYRASKMLPQFCPRAFR
jgi:hypothetical protein